MLMILKAYYTVSKSKDKNNYELVWELFQILGLPILLVTQILQS